MKKQDVINLMKGSVTEDEWNANTNKVKDAFGGDYPPFWYEAIIASSIADEASVRFRGCAGITLSSMSSRPLSLHTRPISMPTLGKDEKVIAVYDQGLGDRRIACSSLEEMQGIYDSYAQGMALTLKWEIASVSETVIPTH